ncbi:hypothetical protein ES703_94535 [subsurface metagenome]
MGWESREGGWQGATVYSSDELIRCEIEELWESNEQVIDDIVCSMIDREWCQRDPYGLRREEALALSWEDFADQVKHHTRYIFFRLSNEEEQFYDRDMIPVSKMLDRMSQEISRLNEDISLVNIIEIGAKIFRARIHASTKNLSTAKDFGTVHLENAIYSNRMSPAGIPMFYGSFDCETAFREITDDNKDKEGKVASIATFNTLRRIKVLDLTNLPDTPSLFDPERRHLRSSLIFMGGFVHELSQPIVKDGNEHIEYVPTQVFTEYIRYLYKDSEEAAIEGILYPSSKNTAGISCVLFIENEHCCNEYQWHMGEAVGIEDATKKKYLVINGAVTTFLFDRIFTNELFNSIIIKTLRTDKFVRNITVA